MSVHPTAPSRGFTPRLLEHHVDSGLQFSPSRGPWPEDSWRGWWGKNPPYHAPTFVLTHHKRSPIAKDIRLLGGAATIRQYLQAKLVDEMHLAVTPIILGSGEHLLAGLDLPALGYKVTKSVPSSRAVHYIIARA